MDKDFNWFVVHIFDDTVGHSPCVTWQILCFCSGCFVWALAPFLCFASLFSLDGDAQIWPGDLRVAGFWWFLVFCLCLIATLHVTNRVHVEWNFLYTVSSHVRTEP